MESAIWRQAPRHVSSRRPVPSARREIEDGLAHVREEQSEQRGAEAREAMLFEELTRDLESHSPDGWTVLDGRWVPFASLETSSSEEREPFVIDDGWDD